MAADEEPEPSEPNWTEPTAYLNCQPDFFHDDNESGFGEGCPLAYPYCEPLVVDGTNTRVKEGCLLPPPFPPG